MVTTRSGGWAGCGPGGATALWSEASSIPPTNWTRDGVGRPGAVRGGLTQFAEPPDFQMLYRRLDELAARHGTLRVGSATARKWRPSNGTFE